jgi:hypothetical protein
MSSVPDLQSSANRPLGEVSESNDNGNGNTNTNGRRKPIPMAGAFAGVARGSNGSGNNGSGNNGSGNNRSTGNNAGGKNGSTKPINRDMYTIREGTHQSHRGNANAHANANANANSNNGNINTIANTNVNTNANTNDPLGNSATSSAISAASAAAAAYGFEEDFLENDGIRPFAPFQGDENHNDNNPRPEIEMKPRTPHRMIGQYKPYSGKMVGKEKQLLANNFRPQDGGGGVYEADTDENDINNSANLNNYNSNTNVTLPIPMNGRASARSYAMSKQRFEHRLTDCKVDVYGEVILSNPACGGIPNGGDLNDAGEESDEEERRKPV